MSLVKNYGKNFLFRKTVTAYEVKSFVDIELKTSSVQKLYDDSLTGLDASTVYTTTVTIAGTPKVISVSGTSIATVAGLASAINSQLGAAGTATFLGSVSGSGEQVIRILAAGASDTVVVTTIGTLIPAIVGSNLISIDAQYGTPCVNGGYNFKLTNAATVSNPVEVGYFVQASSSAGADVATGRVYYNTTGELQVKKSSGSFSVGDVISVFGNIIG